MPLRRRERSIVVDSLSGATARPPRRGDEEGLGRTTTKTDSAEDLVAGSWSGTAQPAVPSDRCFATR